MTMKITRSGHLEGASTVQEFLRALAQQAAKFDIAPNFGAVTDNSTGVAGSSQTYAAPVAGAAVSGSNLATKATVDTALSNTRDALATLFAVANADVAKLGLPQITYNGGGTNGAGTVAAIAKVTTGGATGPSVANFEAIRKAYNGALATLLHHVNTIAYAVGDAALTQTVGSEGPWPVPNATLASNPAVVAALSIDSGTAQTPGVTKVEADATFAAWANDIALIAAKLNSLKSVAAATALAVAVR